MRTVICRPVLWRLYTIYFPFTSCFRRWARSMNGIPRNRNISKKYANAHCISLGNFLYRCAVVYSFVLYPVLVWSVILPLCIHYRIASGYKAIFFIGKSVIYSFQGSHIGWYSIQTQAFRYSMFSIWPFLVGLLFLVPSSLIHSSYSFNLPDVKASSIGTGVPFPP